MNVPESWSYEAGTTLTADGKRKEFKHENGDLLAIMKSKITGNGLCFELSIITLSNMAVIDSVDMIWSRDNAEERFEELLQKYQ